MRAVAVAIALALALPAPAEPTTGGTVRGRVVTVKVDKDGIAKQVDRDPSDVWIYLERVRQHHGPRPKFAPTTATIVQKQLEFSPKTLVVPTGSTITFPNLDREYHNVFSPTAPFFDLGRYKTDRTGKSHRFDDPGEKEIYCDLHKHMEAYIKVVDTDRAWISRVGKNGEFALTGVPPGKYKLHVWTYASDEVVEPEPIEVDDGRIATVPPQNLRIGEPGPHLRKYGGENFPYP